MVASTVALFAAEAFANWSAVANTLSTASMKSLGLTALITGGWLVGLISATVRVVTLK